MDRPESRRTIAGDTDSGRYSSATNVGRILSPLKAAAAAAEEARRLLSLSSSFALESYSADGVDGPTKKGRQLGSTWSSPSTRFSPHSRDAGVDGLWTPAGSEHLDVTRGYDSGEVCGPAHAEGQRRSQDAARGGAGALPAAGPRPELLRGGGPGPPQLPEVPGGLGPCCAGVSRGELQDLEWRLSRKIESIQQAMFVIVEKTGRMHDKQVETCDSARSKLSELRAKAWESTEARLRDFQLKLNDGFGARWAQLEKTLAVLAVDCCSANAGIGDHEQSLQAMADKVKDMVTEGEATASALSEISARVEELELGSTSFGPLDILRGHRLEDVKPSQAVPLDVDASARVWNLEREINNVAERVARLEQEAHGEHGWGSRLEEHEVRLQGLRTKMNGQDEHFSDLSERARSNWERRFEQLRATIHERHGDSLASGERLNALAHWADGAEQTLEDLRQGYDRIAYSPDAYKLSPLAMTSQLHAWEPCATAESPFDRQARLP